ncbi:MAG: ABC transporter ATP-binding protein [Acidimicrobiales bacterium]|nr:ABC transporter ATP-binding protein [Acidimicrobiales bacterium]
MSLVVDGVWKGFATRTGTQWVLRDVSLTIEAGQFIALIGHSGCGKSTLLGALGGLVPIDAGRIVLDGNEVRSPGPDRAVVFQRYSLLPRLSLARNVAVAVRSSRRDWPKTKVDEAVERTLRAVGLWEHRDKKPHQVSGGMQQRCAVARAFAVEPRVLLLDEPFGALDALTRARLQALLVDLWSSESDTEMVVMVTHGIDEAVLLADRVVVMSGPSGPSIIDVIEIDIPRPRDRVTISDDPAFRTAQARLLDLLERDLNWEVA